jgi:hypothetical protein
VASATWAAIRSRLATPVTVMDVPRALLARWGEAEEPRSVAQLLRLLAPLSRSSVR